jgi:hypothetical protein
LLLLLLFLLLAFYDIKQTDENILHNSDAFC